MPFLQIFTDFLFCIISEIRVLNQLPIAIGMREKLRGKRKLRHYLQNHPFGDTRRTLSSLRLPFL